MEKKFQFWVRSEFASLGCTDDGDEIIGFRWFLVAEQIATGRRWGHDFIAFSRWEEQPVEVAHLLRRVEAAQPDPRGRAHWCEIEPAYYARGWNTWAVEAEREDRAQ